MCICTTLDKHVCVCMARLLVNTDNTGAPWNHIIGSLATTPLGVDARLSVPLNFMFVHAQPSPALC